MQNADDTDARPGGAIFTAIILALAFLVGVALAAAGVPLPF